MDSDWTRAVQLIPNCTLQTQRQAVFRHKREVFQRHLKIDHKTSEDFRRWSEVFRRLMKLTRKLPKISAGGPKSSEDSELNPENLAGVRGSTRVEDFQHLTEEFQRFLK